MLDATEFGKLLRELIAKNNLRQGQLATELGVSPSILSNYITGKNIPEMGFIDKCITQFGLDGAAIKEFFSKYFSTTAKENGKIILDVRFFKPERVDLLVEILTILLLYPYDLMSDPNEETLSNMKIFISSFIDIGYTSPSE